MFERKPDQGIIAVQTELLTDAVAVVLNRAVADEVGRQSPCLIRCGR
jgi:hypothetical protein